MAAAYNVPAACATGADKLGGAMNTVDVAIIGLGPVGATAAILLAEAGLQVAAFERDEEVYRLPRAVNLDGEIVRAFQRVGRGQAVDDLMQSVRPGDRAGFANADRQWMFGSEAKDFGVNGWQPMNMFDQPEFEQYLRDQALEHANVTGHIGYEAVALDDRDDGVRVEAVEVNPGAGESAASCRARFAIGCDGASSLVRKLLSIGWQDLGYDHDWLVVDVITRPGHTLTHDTVQVCDPARICTYVCTKDPYRRWEFKLLPGETAEQMLEPETIQTLIDPWTPRGTYDVRRAAVYQFHAAIAEQWRIGNILIAGDAAHQTPPFLGQGMNTGMRDVINLAWKLPLIISGTVTSALLDSYEAERAAHAHDMVDWAVSIGRLMDHLTEVERARANGEEPPSTPAELKSSGYGQGREQPPIRSGVVFEPQIPLGAAGHLFCQPIVRNEHGATFRLDELLGDGFAVVANSDAELALDDPARAILQRLNASLVTLEELQPVRGRLDRLFEKYDAAVVRPDRIVFGHTSADVTLNQLIADLAARLHLN